MFVKVQSAKLAESLKSMGFQCITEIINGQQFFSFQQSPELAKIILDKFADERLIMDDHLHF